MNLKRIEKEMEGKIGFKDVREWMKSYLDIDIDTLLKDYKKGDNIRHIDITDIDNFIHHLQSYAENHPEDVLSATGFIISSKKH